MGSTFVEGSILYVIDKSERVCAPFTRTDRRERRTQRCRYALETVGNIEKFSCKNSTKFGEKRYFSILQRGQRRFRSEKKVFRNLYNGGRKRRRGEVSGSLRVFAFSKQLPERSGYAVRHLALFEPSSKQDRRFLGEPDPKRYFGKVRLLFG